MNTRTSALALCAVALAACSSSSGDTDGPVGEAASALKDHEQVEKGKQLFDNALPDTNGRSCATCHVEDEHRVLTLANAAARFASDPADPLFNPKDADDPTAATPTYDHIMAGLIRVTLALPDNLDLIDADGNVVTGAARTIDVWRAVPSSENTVYSAPYQYDGRELTLESQAAGALAFHSDLPTPPPESVLDDIAAYERTQFSSPFARHVAHAIEHDEPIPDLHFPPGSDEAAGQALFENICATCHGSPTQTHVVDPAVGNQFRPKIKPDGSIDYTIVPVNTVVATDVSHDPTGPQFINIDIAFGTYLAQIGQFPNFQGVSFPQYRVRFYKDGTRTQKVVDLPPPPVDAAGDPIIGPDLAPQAFSVDPGRALISGDPADWEAFDIPQLRGIKNTAPYFHDNLAPDLQTVLDIYSEFVLPVIPSLHLPNTLPPETTGGPGESLSPTQKAQIIAFLQQL
jgi:cytochrome c peroxidase